MMPGTPGVWAVSVLADTNTSYMTEDDLQLRLDNWSPDVDNFKMQQFTMGLQANRTEITKVEALVADIFYTNQLSEVESEEDLAELTASEDIQDIINQLTHRLLDICARADFFWVQRWVHAIFIVMWREGRAVGVREGKRRASGNNGNEKILGRINTGSGPSSSWKEIPLIATNDREEIPSPSTVYEAPAPFTGRSDPPQLTIGKVNFSLEGYTSKKTPLFNAAQMPSTRCVEEGKDIGQIYSYRLSLFLKNFEDLINEDCLEMVYLSHGEIGYLDEKRRFRPIKQQMDFVDAIIYLFTTTPSATLNFRYHKESGVDMRRRLEEEKTQRKLAAAKSPPKPQPRFPALLTENSRSVPPALHSPSFSKQKNTKAKIQTVQARAVPQVPVKRNGVLGRSIQSLGLLPTTIKRRSSAAPGVSNVSSSQEATPAQTSSNPIMSLIKRAGRGKTQPDKFSKPKVDQSEVLRKRFGGLYQVAATTRYTKGGDDDIRSEVEMAEEKERDGEVLDAIEEEEEEEEEEESREFMVNRLQKLLVEIDLTHLHTHGQNSEWLACCQLFGVDPSKTGMEDTVPVFGLTTPLYQYQAFAVYWQMAKSRLIGGGFLADDPGLGKTLTYLAYIVVERQLSWLWNDVASSREQDDGRHLLESSQHANDACPSASKSATWITCPCASSSSTSRMAPKPGVRLAVVPDSLVESWKRAFAQYVVSDNVLKMRLVVASPNNNPPSASGHSVLDSRHPTSVRALKADRVKVDTRGRFDDDEAHAGQERCLVVATASYYKTWIKTFEYEATYKSYDKTGAETWIKGVNPGIVFGIAMIDELHEEGHWQKGFGRSNVLAELPKLNQPHIWGYSGTPFSTSPRVLEGVLWALESHYPKKNMANKKTGWEESAGLIPFSNTNFNTMCINFNALNQFLGKPDAAFRDRAKNFFDGFSYILRTFMLRRTADTSWFGRPLLALKPHVHSDISFRTNSFHTSFSDQLEQLRDVIDIELSDKLYEVQQRWDDRDDDYKSTHPRPHQLSFDVQQRVQWRLRILATFPFLVNLIDTEHEDNLDLTVAEFVKLIGPREKESPYYKHLKPIVESSPKVMWLHSFILELMQQKDVHGEEQKLVIVTNFSPVALIIKLFIERYVKGAQGRVGGVYAGVKQRERTAIIESFTDALDDKGARKQPRTKYRFLVGTTRFLSTGLQLTRACNLVLMEPDFEFSHEIQTYARVHRIGQLNPKTFSYRLTVQMDRVERDILTRQALRNEYPGKVNAYSVELDDGGEYIEEEHYLNKDGGEVAKEQPEVADEDKPHRQQHTTRTSRKDQRSPSRGRSSIPQATSNVRNIIPPIVSRKSMLEARVPTQAGPSAASSSSVTRGRFLRRYAKAIDDKRPQVPTPSRTSSLVVGPRSSTLDGSSKSQSQIRGSSARAAGPSSRGSSASRGNSKGGSIPRRIVPGSILATTQTTIARGGRSTELGRYESKCRVQRAPFGPPKQPEAVSASQPPVAVPAHTTPAPSNSSTETYTSKRLSETLQSMGTVIARHPIITDRSQPQSNPSLSATVQVSPSDAGTYKGSLPSPYSPGSESIQGLTSASSEALGPRLTSYAEHELAASARNFGPATLITHIPSRFLAPTAGAALAASARESVGSDEVPDEIINSILAAQSPDSGSFSPISPGTYGRFPVPPAGTQASGAARRDTRGSTGPVMVNGIPTVYASIHDPPLRTLIGYPSVRNASSRNSGAAPALRRVGTLEVIEAPGPSVTDL